MCHIETCLFEEHKKTIEVKSNTEQKILISYPNKAKTTVVS